MLPDSLEISRFTISTKNIEAALRDQIRECVDKRLPNGERTYPNWGEVDRLLYLCKLWVHCKDKGLC